MTDPSIDDLRRAGTEEAVRPIQARIDEMLTSLPWHGRLIYRAALPASRRARPWTLAVIVRDLVTALAERGPGRHKRIVSGEFPASRRY